MSIILAIESSTDIASVALLLSGGEGVAGQQRQPRLLHRQVNGVQSHSLTVLPMVQALLAEADIGLAECDAIAFGAGPGSFTGVRTACGIAQGLAYGVDLPVVAVDTLAAAAQACRDVTGSGDVLVVVDARMGQVYWCRYRWQPHAAGGAWQEVAAARVAAPESLIVDLAGDSSFAFSFASSVASSIDGRPGSTPDAGMTPCGNGLTAYATALAPLQSMPGMQPGRPDCMPHAAQVAALGLQSFLEGKAVPAREAQPVYLRNDVALTTAERAAKRHADTLDATA